MLPTQEDMARIAKGVAGGLLGFGVGTAFYALEHRRIEFRADRVAAEALEDGKPLVRALQTLRAEMTKAVENNPAVLEAYKNKSPVTRWLSKLTHPSDAERIERLTNWSR